MKRRQQKEAREARTIRLWTHPEAERAVPYIRSVVGSLREHWLEAQKQRRRVERLEAVSGRPGRSALLQREDAVKNGERAMEAFNDTIEELQNIDVYPLDPVQGIALIPFHKEDELAWFVFNLHEEGGLKTWRFHKDPLEERRPITEVAHGPRLIA